ncbi:MAG: hypothetical protein ACPHYF_09285 [Akkermansiaceae bacterium]
MGLFSDLQEIEIEGSLIRLESSSNLIGCEYYLIIDGIKQDRATGLFGTFYLHGRLNEDKESTITVIIKQGFSTIYSVQYKGQEFTPRKIH